jgi:multidrug efflux pump subunit AcrA (membrane-fusion protein)
MTVRRITATWCLAGVLALTGCGDDDGPPPQATVACPPGEVTVTVTNRSDVAERYTVSVAFVRAGDTERESYSSDEVAPGASATITDSRPDEEQTCSIEKTEVFR